MSNNYVFKTENQDLSQGDVLVVRRVQVSQDGVEVTLEKVKLEDIAGEYQIQAPAVLTGSEKPMFSADYDSSANPPDVGVNVEDGINTQEKLG